MNPAANEATGRTPLNDVESPGEQTVSFGAVREEAGTGTAGGTARTADAPDDTGRAGPAGGVAGEAKPAPAATTAAGEAEGDAGTGASARPADGDGKPAAGPGTAGADATGGPDVRPAGGDDPAGGAGDPAGPGAAGEGGTGGPGTRPADDDAAEVPAGSGTAGKGTAPESVTDPADAGGDGDDATENRAGTGPENDDGDPEPPGRPDPPATGRTTPAPPARPGSEGFVDESVVERTSVILPITEEAAARIRAALEIVNRAGARPRQEPERPEREAPPARPPSIRAASEPAGGEWPSAAVPAAEVSGPRPRPQPEGATPAAAPEETGSTAPAGAGEAPPAAEEPGGQDGSVKAPGPDGDEHRAEPARTEPTGSAEPAEREPGRQEPAPEDGTAEPEEARRRVREVPVPEPVSRAFSSALAELREAIIGLHFGLDLPGAVEARKVQAEILSQLGNYVIPRVHMSTAPALIVVAGSTGAGKSTVVNSLAGAKVSATGVRRPTTATPVLVCHPDDREWFARGSVLSGLTRVTRPGLAPAASSFVLTSSPGLPENVALLDTPDIDSAVEENHEIAHRMLDVADLWMFVTTAARYADAPSWHLLRLAKERGARLVIVLARVPPRAREVVVKHFGRMLDDYGLGDVERFVIHETTVTDGRLPDEEIRELRTWLSELSVDDDRRTRAVRATLEGALNSFRVRIPALARQLEAQVAFRAELRTDVDAAYMAALAEIDEATRNGSLLRGEVLARWQDFAGSGGIKHVLHLRRPGRFATRTRQEAPTRLNALKQALGTGLESIIIAAAQRAAEDVVTRWRNRSAVGERLAATPGLGKASDELVRRTGQAVGAWQDHIAELVRTEGVTKRSIARVLSFDVDALAVIFTVGLLGYELSDGAAAGAASLPERLLRGLLGAESLRNIAAKARSDLRARISMLFDEETVRHVHVLDSAGIPDESAATRLYQATYNLEVAR